MSDSFTSENSLVDQLAETVEEVRPEKRKRELRNYVLVKVYKPNENVDDIPDLEKEDTWGSIKQCDVKKGGHKVYYRCNKVKKRGPQCKYLYLHYVAESEWIERWETSGPHNHEHSRPFTVEKKKRIDQLLALNSITPSQIMDTLNDENMPLDNVVQLNNYISRQKKNRYGPNNTVKVGDFITWCEKNSDPPSEVNTPFVLKFTVDGDKVRAIITTKRLLNHLSVTDRLHADGTYKLNWQGLPTVVVGTTDATRKFIPIAVAIVSAETRMDYRFCFESLADAVPQHNIR